MKQKTIGVRGVVFKTNESILKKTRDFLKRKGLAHTAGKAVLFLARSARNVFREYIPLLVLSAAAKNGVLEKTVQGNRMILDLGNDEGISRELALYGVHERQSTAQIRCIVKKGMRILEVGANIGYYALLEGRLAGSDGFVDAIEPSPYNFELLTKNANLNPDVRMELRQAAFGAEKGRATFYVAKKSNLSGLIERDDAKDMYTDRIEVDVLTLDEYMKEKSADLIRMDVEGYEYEVLQGGKQMLRERPPKYFFIEVHSELLHKKGSSGEDIVRTLKGYGYDVIKSFYRGSKKVQVSSTDAFLKHPLREVGYWETFFEHV